MQYSLDADGRKSRLDSLAHTPALSGDGAASSVAVQGAGCTLLEELAALARELRQNMGAWEQELSLRQQYQRRAQRAQQQPADRRSGFAPPQAACDPPPEAAAAAGAPAAHPPPASTFPFIGSPGGFSALGARIWTYVPQLSGPKPWPEVPESVRSRFQRAIQSRWGRASQAWQQQQQHAATMPAGLGRDPQEEHRQVPLRRLSSVLRRLSSMLPTWLSPHGEGSQHAALEPPASGRLPAAGTAQVHATQPNTWRSNHYLEEQDEAACLEEPQGVPLRRLSSLARRLPLGSFCFGGAPRSSDNNTHSPAVPGVYRNGGPAPAGDSSRGGPALASDNSSGGPAPAGNSGRGDSLFASDSSSGRSAVAGDCNGTG